MLYGKAAVVLALGLLLGACSSGGGDGPAPSTPPPPDDPTAPPSELFVLGDSLSDVGNAAAAADHLLSLRVTPPTVGLCSAVDVLVLPRPCEDLFHRQSRVSDGPVAVEYLAAHLRIAELVPSLHVITDRPVTGTNYAVASAKARGQGVEDLSRQVDTLLLDRGFPLPADALYVVMIGGNDAIDALQAVVAGAETAPQTSAAIVSSAVAAVGDNLERLVDFGARQLIVANVPDLGALPAVRADARASGDEAAVLAAASAVSESFDRELDALLEEIQNSGQWLPPAPLALSRFDLRAALREAQNAVAARGGNALDACFDSTTYRESPTAERVFHADCAPALDAMPRFDEFVFWDGIHPTGAAHATVGSALIELLGP